MDGAESGRSSWLRKREWLALRTTARCESRWIRFLAQFGTLFITLGNDGLQGHEEDVFLNGLPPLLSWTSEKTTVVSTPREHAQHGLRGNRVGEADQLGPVMEARVRAFTGAEEVVFSSDVGVHSLGDGSRVRFPLTPCEERSPCRNGLSTHVSCFLAVNKIRMFVITGQFFVTACSPSVLIPS